MFRFNSVKEKASNFIKDKFKGWEPAFRRRSVVEIDKRFLGPHWETLHPKSSMPAVDLYIAYITDQAVGKYNLLPVWLVDALRAQKAFPTLDLGKVRYAEGIETMQGDRPITLEYNIFFPDTLNIADQNADRADVLAVLHELEHVAQTKRHDGVRPYCNKFIIQSAGAVSQSLQRRSWRAFVKNLHEYDGIEKDAVDKAKRLIDVVMEAAIRPPPES